MVPIKETKLTELKEALHYMKMGELKEICLQLGITYQGQKAERIQHIISFLQGEEIKKPSSLPQVSKAKKGVSYPLAKDTLILSGSYKNDAATRSFLKTLIGDYFHFTAFGQDWIKERWIQGNPPTYREFAEYWQKEFQTRKQRKATPKKEWAYLNFVQKYCKDHGNFTRKEITEAWEKHRISQINRAQIILKEYLNKV